MSHTTTSILSCQCGCVGPPDIVGRVEFEQGVQEVHGLCGHAPHIWCRGFRCPIVYSQYRPARWAKSLYLLPPCSETLQKEHPNLYADVFPMSTSPNSGSVPRLVLSPEGFQLNQAPPKCFQQLFAQTKSTLAPQRSPKPQRRSAGSAASGLPPWRRDSSQRR